MKKRTLRDYILPHAGNSFKPLIFGVSSVVLVLATLVFIEAAYVLHTRVTFNHSTYLASVLPGVITDLTNSDRAERGLAMLTPDAQLAKAAQMKADDMVANGYFAHVSPEGKTPWYWLDQMNYAYTYAGENLAVDFTDSKDVEDAWLASPAHYRNLVKPQYTHIGVGVAQGTYEGHATTFVVQLFATPKQVAVAPVPKPVEVKDIAKKPAQAAAVTSVAISTTSDPERVLGAEIAPVASDPTFVAQLAASPLRAVTYVLATLAALFVVLLGVALVVHIRIQYIEVIAAGLIVICAALGLLVFNMVTSTGHIPTVSQVSPSTQTN